MRKSLLAVVIVSLGAAASAHAQAGAPTPTPAPVPAPAPAPLSRPGESAYPQLDDPEGDANATHPDASQPAPAAAAAVAPAAAPSEAPAPESTEVIPSPTGAHAIDAQFVTLDRVDGLSRAGVDLSYTHYDSDAFDVTPLRIGLWGQYVADSGLGGLVALDLSYATGDGESESAIGNLEVGALYAADLGSLQGVGRASLLIPTASDELADFATNVAGIYSRLTDFTHSSANSTWLRLSASPVVRRDAILVRADAGFDLAVSTEDGGDADPFLHANVALGYVQGPHQISAELVNVFILGEDDTSRASSLGASYRGTFGGLSPYAGAFLLLGEEGNNLPDFALTGGVSTLF
jgi:hypothetical protein